MYGVKDIAIKPSLNNKLIINVKIYTEHCLTASINTFCVYFFPAHLKHVATLPCEILTSEK